jgi:hypothetical protein
MFGEPPDIEHECNARVFIADNYGDNRSTMRCQLAPNHDGPHKEQFECERDDGNNIVVVTWTKDERTRCDHGCGQWDHDHQDFVIIAHAIIDGSHGGASAQNGLRSSAKTGPGHYELKIAGILPPDAFPTVSAVSSPVSINSTVIDGVIHVQVIGAAGTAVDADFRVEVAKRFPCPKYADDHEFSDCAFCHPDAPPLICGYCGKTHYYEEGHLRHCAKKPFTCAVCGESGIGNHDWPSGCPKERVAREDDEFA